MFGRGAPGSELFIALARLPLLLLPRAVRRARVQPVAVGELGEALATLVETRGAPAPLLNAVGATALTLGDFIGSLRAQAGRAPARVGTLPDALARWSARAGDHVPVAPWCSETLALLSSDNVAAAEPFERLLAHIPTRFDTLLVSA